MSKTLKEKISMHAERASLEIQEDHGFIDTRGSRSARKSIIERVIYVSIGETAFNREEEKPIPKSKFMEECGEIAEIDLSYMSTSTVNAFIKLTELIDKHKADKEENHD